MEAGMLASSTHLFSAAAVGGIALKRSAHAVGFVLTRGSAWPAAAERGLGLRRLASKLPTRVRSA